MDTDPYGTPIYAHYRAPKDVTRQIREEAEKPWGPSWQFILDQWNWVLLDLHETFGADWHDPNLERHWPWWQLHIIGLFSTETRVARLFHEKRKD